MASYLTNTILKIVGNTVKTLGYPYHLLSPRKRFTLPEIAPAKAVSNDSCQRIPRIVWQTNFTDKYSWPLWINYRVNRHFAQGYEFRYVSTEARNDYMRTHADERTYRAYCRLTDGAAQADLWRIVVLYNEGGIYLDIDGCLVTRLGDLLKGKDQLWIAAHGNRATNYLVASVPGNIVLKEYIESIVYRIENYSEEYRAKVFYVTGPGAVRHILARHGIKPICRKQVCLTGLFVNEHFQYIDRPHSKWGYKKTFILPEPQGK